MHRILFLTFLLIAMVSLAVASCGGNDFDAVGAACALNSDCPGGRCLTGGKYPNGTCSYSCDNHNDCPSHAACIDRDGGVCLPVCEHHRDCRGGYECDDQRNRGTSGRSYVCIND
ncbi:MAG: hypothetical protein ACNA8W_08505 [Bradymonadaceae bacterium]